jgi:hypothetical protein
VVLLPLVIRARRGAFDVFEPTAVFAAAYVMMFVVRPAAMLVEDELVFLSARASLAVSDTFTEMLVLALFGAVSFVVGYELPVGARLAKLHVGPDDSARPRDVVAAAAVVGLVGLVSYLAVLARSGLTDALAAIFRAGNTELPDAGSATMYASFAFLLLVPASAVAFAIALVRRRLAYAAVAVSLSTVFAVVAVPSGRRIALLPLVGGAIVLWYLSRGARPSARALFAVAVVAVLGATFLSDLRGRATRDEGVVATVERSLSPSRVLDAVTSGPDTEMAPALAAALTAIPEELGHRYGAVVFGDLLRRPVPRSLWEDKPLIPRHELIASVWPVEYERGTINAEFSVLLYFYWDFGVPGLVLGLAALGLLARYLYEYYLRFRERPYAQVVYALGLWFVVIGLRDSPVDTFVRACFVVVPVWAIFALARRAGRRAETRVAMGPRPA